MTILAWDGKKLATDTAVTTTQGGAVFVSPIECFKLRAVADMHIGRNYSPESYTEIRGSKIRNIAVCGSEAESELLISYALGERSLDRLLGPGHAVLRSCSASLLILTCDGNCYRMYVAASPAQHGIAILRLKPIRGKLYLDGSGKSVEHIINACRVDDAVIAAHLISKLDAGCGGRVVWTDTTDQEILVSHFENGEMKGDTRYKEELEAKLKEAMMYFQAFMNGGITPVVDHTPEELEQRKKEKEALKPLDAEFDARAKEVLEAIRNPPVEPTASAEPQPTTTVPTEAANDPIAA